MLREFCNRLVVGNVHQLLFYESTDFLMRNKLGNENIAVFSLILQDRFFM